jgi:hypothetical protein
MRTLFTALVSLFVVGQTYPPAYPRAGATKLLENESVVVWNIAWLKGQPSALHRHIYDLTGVYYEPGDRMIIAVDGSKRPVSTKAWDIAFQLKGVTHIEEGTSESPLRAVFVEMKQDRPYGTDAAEGALVFPGGAATPRIDNERVTVWQYAPTAAPQHKHVHDAVVVWFDGPTPHAAYITRGTVHRSEGIDNASRAFIFELK